MSESCRDCRFGHGWYGNSARECRRFPPTMKGDALNTRFPMVNGGDWCGEYQPQEPIP